MSQNHYFHFRTLVYIFVVKKERKKGSTTLHQKLYFTHSVYKCH